MLAEQNIAVDYLLKIIQDIRVWKMTGSLVVTRGEGVGYESGTLVFFNGRVVQGRTGRREGREAFDWLLTWGKCRYTFMRSIRSGADLYAKRRFSNRETPSEGRIPHVRLVPLEQTQWLQAARDEGAMRSWPDEKLEQLTQKRESLGELGQVNEAVPYVSKPLGYALQILAEKGLSRLHRQVLLLVDGSRRVGDLMRLLALNEKQVLALLYDLQISGIIVLSRPYMTVIQQNLTRLGGWPELQASDNATGTANGVKHDKTTAEDAPGCLFFRGGLRRVFKVTD